jgi:hypothetical protein
MCGRGHSCGASLCFGAPSLQADPTMQNAPMRIELRAVHTRVERSTRAGTKATLQRYHRFEIPIAGHATRNLEPASIVPSAPRTGFTRDAPQRASRQALGPDGKNAETAEISDNGTNGSRVWPRRDARSVCSPQRRLPRRNETQTRRALAYLVERPNLATRRCQIAQSRTQRDETRGVPQTSIHEDHTTRHLAGCPHVMRKA